MVLWIPPCLISLRLRGFHPLRLAFPGPFCWVIRSLWRSEPRGARTPVWAPPVPLAATPGIILIFFSSGYLDVSVHRVPSRTLWIHVRVTGVSPAGFPHSDTRGSAPICGSPRLFAAYRVFLRLLVPRHPPCALLRLTFPWSSLSRLAWRYSGTLPGSPQVFLLFRTPYGVPSDVLSYLVFQTLILKMSISIRFSRYKPVATQQPEEPQMSPS